MIHKRRSSSAAQGQSSLRGAAERTARAAFRAQGANPTGVSAALLLADPSPCLRRLVLRELLQRPEDDAELRELAPHVEADPFVAGLVSLQRPDGSWDGQGLPGLVPGASIKATAVALSRLGSLGLGPSHPAVRRGAEYLFARQLPGGEWPLPGGDEDPGEREGYTLVPLQTSLPLAGLALAGYAADPRAERAYDWMASQRLPDGAWPTGIAAGGVYGRVAGYRRLAHSRWGCRSNTTAALLCLAHHPERRKGQEAARALDLLLGRETREAYTLGFEVARRLGLEPARGFLTYYARFDLALLLDLCSRVGASLEDERVRGAVEFVRGLRGPYGLWEYAAHPQASRWLTFDLLRSLSRLGEAGDWLSREPRTPFSAYRRERRRY